VAAVVLEHFVVPIEDAGSQHEECSTQH
jgi:hypothetical protein